MVGGGGGVFDTFATLVDLVYDVTDTAAGHKMTALTVAFSRLSNVDFLEKSSPKLPCQYFIPFLSLFHIHSIPVDISFHSRQQGLLRFRSPLISAFAVL